MAAKTSFIPCHCQPHHGFGMMPCSKAFAAISVMAEGSLPCMGSLSDPSHMHKMPHPQHWLSATSFHRLEGVGMSPSVLGVYIGEAMQPQHGLTDIIN